MRLSIRTRIPRISKGLAGAALLGALLLAGPASAESEHAPGTPQVEQGAAPNALESSAKTTETQGQAGSQSSGDAPPSPAPANAAASDPAKPDSDADSAKAETEGAPEALPDATDAKPKSDADSAKAEAEGAPEAEPDSADAKPDSDADSAKAETESTPEAKPDADAKPEGAASGTDSTGSDSKTAETPNDADLPVAEGGEGAGQNDPNSIQSDAEPAVEEPASKVLITVNKESQELTVWVDGVEQYTWPVSTGLRGYSTPSGTYPVTSMNKIWYSRQWDNAPMPHAIFFTKKGHAIHGSLEVKRLGTPASHGCVRLSPENAESLFTLIKEKGLKNTEVVLTGVTPGGEAKVAAPSQNYDRSRRGRGWYGKYGYYEEVEPRRKATRKRRWFQPYYDAPPQYYQPRQRPRFFRPPGY